MVHSSRRQDLRELPFVMLLRKFLSLLIIPRRISLSADFTDGIALYWLHITCTFFLQLRLPLANTHIHTPTHRQKHTQPPRTDTDLVKDTDVCSPIWVAPVLSLSVCLFTLSLAVFTLALYIVVAVAVAVAAVFISLELFVILRMHTCTFSCCHLGEWWWKWKWYFCTYNATVKCRRP